MSVKIKVSYTTDKELAGVIRLLSPVMVTKRMSRNKEGRYKKAYIEIDKNRLERLVTFRNTSKPDIYREIL